MLNIHCFFHWFWTADFYVWILYNYKTASVLFIFMEWKLTKNGPSPAKAVFGLQIYSRVRGMDGDSRKACHSTV